MHTQRQMLEAACKRQDIGYTKLAEQLRITRQALSQFKLGAPFPRPMVISIAELAGLDPVYVAACVEYQRDQRLERTETLPLWQKIAEHFADHAKPHNPHPSPAAAKRTLKRT